MKAIFPAILLASLPCHAQQTYTFVLSGEAATWKVCTFVCPPEPSSFAWTGNLSVTVPSGDGTFSGRDLRMVESIPLLALEVDWFGDSFPFDAIVPVHNAPPPIPSVTVLDGAVTSMTTLGLWELNHWEFEQTTTPDGSFVISFNDTGKQHADSTLATGLAVPSPLPDLSTWLALGIGVGAIGLRTRGARRRETAAGAGLAG